MDSLTPTHPILTLTYISVSKYPGVEGTGSSNLQTSCEPKRSIYGITAPRVMHNDTLIAAAIRDLDTEQDSDSDGDIYYDPCRTLRKLALSPRFTFINLDELRFINDSDYQFNFSGDEVQIQKILLYLFSCDFYAMYCDKFFRTIENGVEHRIFRWWHMRNGLPNNMVANYIRYVMSIKNIVDCDSLLTDEAPLDDNYYYDPNFEHDPRFLPLSTQYYILCCPFQEDSMYERNEGYSYPDLCYAGISPHELQWSVFESEARRVFASREAVVERQIYHAVYNTWRIAVEEDGTLMKRAKDTDHTDKPNGVCQSPTSYFNPELPLPKYHTNNWWLDLHNFTLTVDDIRASKVSIEGLVSIDYIGAFLYTHKEEFNDYRALADITSELMDNWLNDEIKQRFSMLYINANPQYYLDFYEQDQRLLPDSLMKSLCLLRYLLLRVYQRTITAKDLESYYLYLPVILRKEFVNKLSKLPMCDFNLFYPFIVDTCPSDGSDVLPFYTRLMSFNKTQIGYHMSPAYPSQARKTTRSRNHIETSSPVGYSSDVSPAEPVHRSLTIDPDTDGPSPEIVMKRGGILRNPIIISIGRSVFALNPCGFDGVCSKLC